MNKKITATLICAGAALIAGCGKRTPAGQVAAVVNGKDVTLQEINTELLAANVPATADKQIAQRALLQQVIDRKLLVDAAHDKGIDKTPEFLAQKRRAEEMLLVQAYAKQQLSAVPVPSAADVDKFIADHANVYSQREQLQIDQIRFPRPQNPTALKALQNDHSQDAVAATLAKLGIKYQRGNTAVDSGTIPTNVMAQLNKLPAGEPFVVPGPQGITINVITGRRPIAIDATKARPAATAAWRQERFGEMLKRQLDSLKGTAKITYQNGFGPPPAGAPGGPPANASVPPAPMAPAAAAAPAPAPATPAPAQ